jgi:hypothetical protein
MFIACIRNLSNDDILVSWSNARGSMLANGDTIVESLVQIVRRLYVEFNVQADSL